MPQGMPRRGRGLALLQAICLGKQFGSMQHANIRAAMAQTIDKLHLAGGTASGDNIRSSGKNIAGFIRQDLL